MKLSPQETYNLVIEQIQFLQTSCIAVYNGNGAEAKRVANVLRLLAHSDKSKSLLNKLKVDLKIEKEIYMLDKAGIDYLSFVKHCQFYSSVQTPLMHYNGSQEEILDNFNRIHTLDYWLTRTVYKMGENVWTRDKAIRFLRNKLGGGGHIADSLNDEDYKTFKEVNLIKVFKNGPETKEEKLALIAAIVYEAGISMFYSITQYLSYVRDFVDKKNEHPWYANLKPER